MLNLKNHSLDEFYGVVAPFGLREPEARRLFAHIFAHDRDTLEGVRGLSPRVLARLAGTAPPAELLPRLEISQRHVSPTDGFTKYLFRTADGGLIESVRIPLPKEGGPGRRQRGPAQKRAIGHYTLCISSQVGCPLACTFCATGRMGFTRNLDAWEIVDQVIQVRREADLPVRGIVFMGQGEPFLNYDNVIRASRILSSPAGLGIAAKAITISTAGIVPAIRRFTAERWKFRLAVSLTAAQTEKRRVLMPIEKKHALPELMAAIREYAASTRGRIVLEYVAIAGVNCGEEDARAIAALLEGIKVRFNIIEVNDATGTYLPPDAAELEQFRSVLAAELRQPIVRRYSGGKDVHAACGMLAAVSP